MNARDVIEGNNFEESYEAVLAKKDGSWGFVLILDNFHVEIPIPTGSSKELEAALHNLKGAVAFAS